MTDHDVVLYHPYDSFQPVVAFLKQAAIDPDVMAIKITFYRIDNGSPLVEALMEARRNGKAVAAVLELKAKFDETNNISWARQLEHAGVHVVYGPVDIKIHAKMCLIVKKSHAGPIRLCHLSSGNYNTKTARIYGDIGYLTSDPQIASDVSDLFNALTGYCQKDEYRKLLVSPNGIRKGIMERIEREIAQQGPDRATGTSPSRSTRSSTRGSSRRCTGLPWRGSRSTSTSGGCAAFGREWRGSAITSGSPRSCPASWSIPAYTISATVVRRRFSWAPRT